MSDSVQKNLNYKKYVIDSKLQYFKPHATKIEKTFAEEIHSSLTKNQKSIAPKFFYDKKGSALFEKICSLPEYYPTRTEIMILKKLQTELSDFFPKIPFFVKYFFKWSTLRISFIIYCSIMQYIKKYDWA